jgi:hypothetical protein
VNTAVVPELDQALVKVGLESNRYPKVLWRTKPMPCIPEHLAGVNACFRRSCNAG